MGVQSLPTPFPGSHLYVPNDGKPHPAIVLLHGSEGGDAGFSDAEAIALAQKGFATLAFDYVGKSAGLPKELANVEITRASDAARWLKDVPEVAGKKVGLFGASRGAEQALLLASLQQDTSTFAAVAAHAPHATVVGSFNHKTGGPVLDKAGAEQPAWLVDGKPINSGAIAIENFAGPVFLSQGTKDEVWDVGQTKTLARRLERAGKKPEVHLYPGEHHALGFGAERKNEDALASFFHHALGD
ncbi:MAG TPA: prolyl oligopeptidase family serine peptidase [Myxococcota bacterium]